MSALPVLGSYVARKTAVSVVDARVKVLLLLSVTAAVFLTRSLLGLVAWLVALALCAHAARMDARGIVRALKPVCIILAFTLCANLASCDGSGDVQLVGSVGLNLAGGLRGLMAVLRIVLLVGFSLIVASSTTPTQVSDAVVRLLRPLGRLGVPVGAVGTVLSLALRFIPLVAEEFDRIRMAQRARGVRFDKGSVLARISVWASVLTPLVVGLFRRADRLSDSMAARCYAGTGGVQVPRRSLCRRDWAVLAFGLLAMVALVLATNLP